MGESSTTLSIILKLVDNASAGMSGFSKTIEDNKAQIQAVGLVAGAVFAATSAEIYKATEAAAAHQNVEAQLAAVIKSTGDAAKVTQAGMDGLAQNLMMLTGYSRETITSIETLFIQTKTIGNDIMPQATQATLDLANRMGMDATAAAKLLAKALGDPTQAVGALTRAKVILSEAQKEEIKNFAKAGDIQAAQKVILDALSEAVGGASEQTNTFAFQQRLLQSQLEVMQVTIGTALLPIITTLLTAIAPVIEKVTEWASEHPKLTAAILLGVAAFAGLVMVFAAVALAIPAILAFFNPITAAIIGTVAAVTGLVLVFKHFFDLITQNWDKVKPFFDAVGKVGGAIGGMVGGAVSSVGSAIGSLIPHFAAGGIVSGPTLALIGEGGPEAVVPLGSGGGMGGGITVNIGGGYYLDQNAARDFGNMLAATIGRQLKLRNYAV